MDVTKSFIEWYLVARFGKFDESKRFNLDRKADGGIDAILYKDGEAFVFQMKYEKKPRLSLLSKRELGDFEDVSDHIFGRSKKQDLKKWINSIRERSRQTVKDLLEFRKHNKSKVRMVLVTSKRNKLVSDSVEIKDYRNILILFGLYNQGKTPALESMYLKMKDRWDYEFEYRGKSYKTYVGLVDVANFLKYMRYGDESLFSQNVRTDKKSTINEGIKACYDKDPKKFWFYNNGLYIVCDTIKETGDSLQLSYPSIINGSQTLHSIKDSEKKHDCRILTRIMSINVGEDSDFLSEIIRRTNTQNPMLPENLFAHDPLQVNLARYVDRFNIFYERREKEWENTKHDNKPNYINISVRNFAKWFSLLNSSIGLGTARSKVKSLFEDKNYEKIFGKFDSFFESKYYKKVGIVIWSGLFVKNMNKRKNISNAKILSESKNGNLLMIKLVIRIISSKRSEIENKLTEHKFGKNMYCKKLNKSYLALLRIFMGKRRKIDEEIASSDFFKDDKKIKLLFGEIIKTKEYKKFSNILVENIKNIE
jgi:hypothetical protein